MLTALFVQSFSFKMSVKNAGFPLPVKIEEDQKLFIDLDSEGNSPEDIVIEWHLEMRRFFGRYSAASGETVLVSIMKEYIIAITERAIHFEDIIRLHEMVERHMEHIYWFYRDSDVCFSDAYLDYMEHIMTFYVNLTLRVLLVLKKKIKVTQKKVMDMTQKVIKRLSFYLLKSEYHIFHVLIRQTATQLDGMIKDVMNILNSNICKQMFRNLYMHFLVLTPVRDMSDEAFCRAFILFENWKAFEDYKQNEKIDECIRNIFNRDASAIRDSEFLSEILTPKTTIMSELMKAMGCDPSITKAYFDYIKSKEKVEGEILDDIGKLALEDALLTDTELLEDEDDDADYIELFDQIMGNAKYDLKEVVLDSKNERSSAKLTSAIEDTEILVLDTDSDSDVEIVSITPSQPRNPATKTQPVTSFLESISVDVDTAKRKYGFRTVGTSRQNKVPEANNTPTTPLVGLSEEEDSAANRSVETCLIIDNEDESTTAKDASKHQSITESVIDVDTSEKEATETNNTEEVQAPPEDMFSDVLPEILSDSDVRTQEKVTDVPKTPEIVSSNPDDTEMSEVDAEEVDSQVSSPQAILETVVAQQETSPSETPQVSNGVYDRVCRGPETAQSTPRNEKDDEKSKTTSLNPSKSPEAAKVVVERIPLLEDVSQNIRIAGLNIVAQEMMVASGKPETEMTPVQIVTDSKIAEKIGTPRLEPIESGSPEGNDGVPVRSEQGSGLENKSPVCSTPAETCEQLKVQLDASRIASEHVAKASEIRDTKTSGKTCTEDSNEFKECDRTLQSGKVLEITNCNGESEVSVCRTATEECENTPRPETDENVNCAGSVVNSHTDEQSEETTPLDTGQDQFALPLDTGQFDPNSPASPETLDIALKPSNVKGDERKLLRTVSDSLIRKGQQHGEFGYPTPPGSEEEREKDSDEHADLIYSNILPTKAFSVDETPDVHDFEAEPATELVYEALTPNDVPGDDFLCEEVEVGCVEHTTADSELLDALSNEEKGANPSLGKSYEQIVKDAVGSQNSTEDEDEAPVTPKKNGLGRSGNDDDDGNISFDEMEQFLKSCDNDDFQPVSRKKRKRAREKLADDSRSKKNSRSPKRVKINDTPETHFIPASYDENSKDDVWEKKNEYDSSSSSSDNEDRSPSRLKARRRPSPMPLSKYLCKRNGATTRVPLSGRFSPEKPPPLKGILKRIEQKHTYHPLHPVDDEPETVVIVLHQRDLGRGKRGSVEVKVYRKSFITYKVPFDDGKLCDHRACVELDQIRTGDVAVWGRVSDRTRVYEEEMCGQPEKPMYKIVFDKKTPQLNSNDRKYYCDPSISSPDSTKRKNSLLESDHEQGTVNSSTEIVCTENPEPDPDAIPPPAAISPPCFSPSSNGSSEFSDPTNLIPYQDIERALQVVEPDKPEEAAYGLECHVSNDGTEKLLVDRIALETIELLSNNADFHKMLRDLNGEVFIENVPLISIQDASGVESVLAVNADDLVSNLNSDEQLLKKVCQELESKALVDNLEEGRVLVATECPEGTRLIDETDGQGMRLDSEIGTDEVSYPADHEVQVSSYSAVPISLHILNPPVVYADTNPPLLNGPVVTASYPASDLSANPNSLQQFSSAPDLPLAHSNYAPTNSPSFPPKMSPVIPSLSPYHPDLYQVSHYPSNANPSPHHQQVYSSISNVPVNHPGYGTNFSVSESPSLTVNSATIIPHASNSVNQKTYPISETPLRHSGYSELPGYAAKALIPNCVYPEVDRSLRTPPSAHSTYPLSHAPYSVNIASNSYSHALPQYAEPNFLISSVPSGQPSYPERKLITPSPTSNVPNYRKAIGEQPARPYVEPISSAPEPRSLRSCRYSPNVSSESRNKPANKMPQKTDRRRSRLPKEVLTISQMNASKSKDNNSKTNLSVRSSASIKTKTGEVFPMTIGGRPLSTDTSKGDVGQPQFPAPSPAKELNANLSARKLVCPRNKKRRIAHSVNMTRKAPVLTAMAKKALSRARKVSKLENSRQAFKKILEPAPRAVFVAAKSKPQQQNVTLVSQNLTDLGCKQGKVKTPVRKRGRPPKSTKAEVNARIKKKTQDIPSNSNCIPLPVTKNAQPRSYNNERVPLTYPPEILASRTNLPESRPRIEPLKIIKDPDSKNYTKVVKAGVKSPMLPMPVPAVHNYETDYPKNEVYNMKMDVGDGEIDIETHLPLKKRKLTMPVRSPQPTTLANVPRTRSRKDDISYPATPMLSIADVYIQPRSFKTPAEKKQLPPESSNTVPVLFEPQSDPQYGCGYSSAVYGFGKCPYNIELDCNPYCPPPVLFPPESFTHNN